ncbi:MAG: DUF11 domain-containing protein [Chloroflexi bacterium]|nr:DUF11 domain-containing protein [Chloroflexota bacterium]MCI0576131.1 DUF11 domain-containing protein [Chloroflexota bacterium]MCI0647919.1 DUF11 domain-containing protein [Chloroflexota bacterium]MCI0727170.1 DUF11 domain-containing protein [Chloroflexota bacterium]
MALVFAVTQNLQAQQGTGQEEFQPATLDGSSKVVDQSQALPGEILGYTVIISNSGSVPATNVTVTDTLPISLTYQSGSLAVAGGGLYGESNGVITWTGAVNNNAQVIITFNAVLSGDLPVGAEIQNTVYITGLNSLITRTATTEVISSTGSTTLYLPTIFKDLSAPILNPIGRPNSNNQWTVSWNPNNTGTINFELQESFDPSFTTILNTYNAGTATSQLISQTPGLRNVFYYRVRAIVGSLISPWSNVQSVIGGYRDEFNDPTSGWAIRRTTYIEEVRFWYENGRLIFQVEDPWDWGIASPMVQAPDLPYVIEYRSEPANLGNLVSHGAVFGGDWPGAICPDYSTIGGVYYHDLCFNHFYNANTIWYGPLKLAFERVDFLVWCPQCGGSPMKRLADDYSAWFTIDPIPSVNSTTWNDWRIEVRATGINFSVNGDQYAFTSDTTWVNDRYFGVFGSTDEYSNSTWRYEYYQVMPLDN